jgi:hypothetical protein
MKVPLKTPLQTLPYTYVNEKLTERQNLCISAAKKQLSPRLIPFRLPLHDQDQLKSVIIFIPLNVPICLL